MNDMYRYWPPIGTGYAALVNICDTSHNTVESEKPSEIIMQRTSPCVGFVAARFVAHAALRIHARL
jgi:hypothetical protein